MLTELTQIRVKTHTDILHLHHLALQIAGWAGLSVPEQICFAVNVSNNSFQLDGEGEQVVFSIYQPEESRSFLKAELKRKSYVIERELSRQTVITDLLPFYKTSDAANQWEKYRDMQQFTFALAHDLKNSLTKLRLALSLAVEEEMSSPLTSYMQIIQRSADRLEGMMLSLNKIIELGDASPAVVKKISAESVFAEVSEEFTESILKTGASVVTDFSEINEINYIEVYLKSIFSNVLSNAIKYSSPDRPLHFSVTAVKQDKDIIFTFSDNGQGIDLAVFGDKLFLPFTRFSNKIDGSGVGLYLIKNIVERNGGIIEADSIPGIGTSFRVILREYNLPS